MTSIDPIRDIRFEGMDIPQLQEWITQIKQGRGAESMQGAVRALDECVQVVVDLDETLRRELGKLQIAWEGNAGSLAAAAVQQQSAFMADAPDPLKTSADSVDAQGRGYESARNGLPNNDELKHKQSENVLEWAGGAFGYESDYDKEARQIEAQKQAAQAALVSYRNTSVNQADSYQPLPEMPPATVSAQSASGTGMPGIGAGVGSVGGYYGGGASDAGVLGGVVGGGNAVGGTPRGDRTAPPVPGDRSGSDRHPDERDTGGEADQTPEAAGTSGGINTGTVLGIAAGGAAVAGVGAYAASRMLGGRTPAGAGAGGGTTGLGRGGSSGIGGGPGDTVAGRAAGSTPGSRPGTGSLMGPAATRGEKRSEDAEHENKYVAEETPFDDERLVAPPVLGHFEPDTESDEESDDDEPKKRD
ncbi:PPE domain-containing protein [Saccharopolyspora sp. ASAGF58]|uniref:PPE domain-containing protein n=1 Tax=Saccharopolyspora sp. ASAGF58 TaxID=2719023 RepID=UPI00143FF7F0|nr:PPE domain-containing protein [Saccharopolyspora sp. ASAGF58]QIZ34268.1 PPE domain-containing protein [Saccharopolyspora sp. ASAGF58]